MQHACGRREAHSKFYSQKVTGRIHLGDLNVDVWLPIKFTVKRF